MEDQDEEDVDEDEVHVKPKPVKLLTAEEQRRLDRRLYGAAYNGDVDKAEEVIKEGAIVNSVNWDGDTPLTIAVQQRQEAIVDVLLQHEADPNLSDRVGDRPLTIAVLQGREAIVDVLLKHEADPNLSDGYGRTPLTIAVQQGQDAIVDVLLQHETDPNLSDRDGDTPLTLAVQRGQEAIVDVLLQHEADPNLIDRFGQTPLTIAVQQGQDAIVDVLLQHEADPNLSDKNGGTPLTQAVLWGRESIIQLLLQYKADPNLVDMGRWAPLHYADSPEIAEVLIRNGANYTVLTNDKDSVLHTACENRRIDVVEYFLSKGLSVGNKNKHGETPLHKTDSVEVAELLVRSGADVKALTNDNDTVLHTACKEANEELVEYYLKNGLHVGDKNKFGEMPIHCAWGGDVAECLVSNGADLQSLTPDSNTVLHSACKYGHVYALDYLLKNGLSLQVQNKKGQTPIDVLKQPGDDENVLCRRKMCLEHLKDAGLYSESDDEESDGTNAELSSHTRKDYTPLLMKAAEEGTVNTKWTNFSIGGASGVGKTSVLNLLLDNPPVLDHNSTPVIQPLPVCIHEEHGRSKEDPMESHVIVADKRCHWKTAEKDDLHRKLAECIQALGGVSAILDHGKVEHPEVHSTSKQISSAHAETPTTSVDTTTSSFVLSLPSSSTTRVPFRIQPQACLAKSEATRKVLELLAVVKQSIELDQTHFIHLLDTGGQASFIDIAPALLRFNSVNIFIHKLDEKLEDLANFYYSVEGTKVGEEHRRVTNEELLSQLFSARRGIRQPEVNESLKRIVHGKPHMLIIGTYFDEYETLEKEGKLEETIKEKNRRLLLALNADKQVIVYFNPSKVRGGSKTAPEIIFPLNAISRDEREKRIAERIRGLASQAYMQAEIPVRWYLIQIDLNDLKASKQNMISITELFEKGFVLGMDEEEVKGALQYFHDLTIILYFHKVLPNVVFLSPECLFNKLSEIIAISLGEHSKLFQHDIVDRLLTEGIFDISLFDNLPDGFNKDLFTAEDFLKLMEHLLVITPLSNGKSFFIPCVLKTLDDPMDNLPESEVEPVILKWKDAVPSGLFPSLAMALYQSKVTKIEAFEGEEQLQFRNKLSFYCPDLEACLILFELPRYLGVVHTASAEDSPVVLKAVMKAIEFVVESFQWEEHIACPEVGFLHKVPHSATADFLWPNKNNTHLVCRGYNKLLIDQQRHLSWFPERVCSQRSPAKAAIFSRPQRREVFNILKKRSARWNRFGLELEVSDDLRDQLAGKSMSDPEKLDEILRKWIESESRPVTWDTVLDVLKEMEMNDLVREVLQHLQ